jgi:hypothetical protein
MPGPSMESPLLNPDFRDMLSIFNEESVKYLIVGAYALAAYGHPRATRDLDLWGHVLRKMRMAFCAHSSVLAHRFPNYGSRISSGPD